MSTDTIFWPNGVTYYDRLVTLVTVSARGSGRPWRARGTGRASRRAGRAPVGASGAVAARRAAVHVPAGWSAGRAAGPHAPGLSVGALGAVIVGMGPVVAGAAGAVAGTRRLEKRGRIVRLFGKKCRNAVNLHLRIKAIY